MRPSPDDRLAAGGEDRDGEGARNNLVPLPIPLRPVETPQERLNNDRHEEESLKTSDDPELQPRQDDQLDADRPEDVTLSNAGCCVTVVHQSGASSVGNP